MKVVYKQSVLERIYGAAVQAGRHNKKIDYILVSHDEMRELRESVYYASIYASTTWRAGYGGTPTPAAFRCIELLDPDAKHDPRMPYYRRFPVEAKVLDIDIVEVPERFLK